MILAPFKTMLQESEIAREDLFWKFRAFYDQDYDEIQDYIKGEILNKPFSKETLSKMIIAHIDFIQKTLNRKTAGIYTKQPNRKLLTNGEKEDDNLDPLLMQSHYKTKVKDVFRKSEFFNTVAMQFVYRDGEIDIDVYTPESFRVFTSETNYLKPIGIMVRKSNGETGEIYSEVWTDNENYSITQDGNKVQTGKNNPQNKNPYGELPFVFLRKKEGLDFYGEPNWNLLRNQIAVDIKISDNDRAEYFNKYKIAHGTDTDFPTGTRLDPGVVLQSKSAGDKTPSLTVHDFSIDFGALSSVVQGRMKQTLMSEGLPESSASTDNTAPKQFNSKLLDELELQETREETIERLVEFEIGALKKLRVVNNYHVNSPKSKLKKLSDGEFECEFIEIRPKETIEEKKLRREYEQQFLGMDEIDFVMEDKGLTEEEAVAYIQTRKDRSPAPPPGNNGTASLLDQFKGVNNG